MRRYNQEFAPLYPTPSALSQPSSGETKSLVVEFRSGEAVHQHPDLVAMLKDGWHIQSAIPHCVDPECTKLQVELILRPDSAIQPE